MVASATFSDVAVQLAVLGIWLVCMVINCAFALVARATRPAPQPA